MFKLGNDLLDVSFGHSEVKEVAQNLWARSMLGRLGLYDELERLTAGLVGASITNIGWRIRVLKSREWRLLLKYKCVSPHGVDWFRKLKMFIQRQERILGGSLVTNGIGVAP